MPNFNARPRGPLTPPESGHLMYGGYRGNGQQGQYGQPSRKPTYDFAPPPAPIMYQPPPMHYAQSTMPAVPPPGMPRTTYGPIAAPLLPLPHTDRVIDASHHSSRRERPQEQRRHQQPAAKEQKITGGVAQELDYEMDQMTDYVSDMAQSIVMPQAKVTPPFRKFVSGLLSSTRLPSSTILLGLNYLARRMSMLNSPGNQRKTTEGQVWRMLTIALLLGSKFLDDNTFQNRSWSEVSGIPVSELNTLEKEWLDAIEWNLHVDAQTDSDYQSWLASWASWREDNNKQRNATLERLAPLAPIDTNLQHHHHHHQSQQQLQHQHGVQQKPFSPPYSAYGSSMSDNMQGSVYQAPQVRYDQAAWSQQSSTQSPPSAPESGPNTPEWMVLPGSGMPPSDWYGYPSFYNSSSHPTRRNTQPTAQMPFTTMPYIAPYGPYTTSIWGHPQACPCNYCNRAGEPYVVNAGYGQQTVAG